MKKPEPSNRRLRSNTATAPPDTASLSGDNPWVPDNVILEEVGFTAPIYFLDGDRLSQQKRRKLELDGLKHELLPASKGSYYVKLPKFIRDERFNSPPTNEICYISVAFLKLLESLLLFFCIFHEEFDLAVDLINHRRVDLKPLLTGTYALDDARLAFEAAGDRTKSMKVQLAF